jgi:long-chain acyl-CoA synthetase
MPEPATGPAPRNLLPHVERLRRYGGLEAYLWREGVRWRRRTYARLHEGILACAARLREAGLRDGGHVLIQGPDHPDWVEAFLGTLWAGGVAVPLELSSPEAFRSEVTRQVGARLFVAPAEIEAPRGCRRLAFGSWQDARASPRPPAAGRDPAACEAGYDPAGLAAPADPGPEARAEIAFTSGTTGTPKGVVLTHGNLASDFHPLEQGFLRREALVRRFGRMRFLSTLPLSHMFGQAMSVFLPLYMGLTVVLVPARPRDVLDAARRQRAWGLFTIPRLLDLLAADVRRRLREAGRLEDVERRQRRLARWPYYLQSLAFWRVQRLFGWRFRLVVVGGAPLPEAVQLFWERLGYLVVQGYGLTETAPIVSISDPFERRTASVGRPLGDQEVRLGPGGEVLVRGPNVTPGYLGREGAVEWLHTGDVGEIDAGGRLRIRGRLKDVIVTPEGENVHPEDVEAAFRGVPGVREACVLGLPHERGERVLAVLLLERGADPDEAVRRANARLLPRQRVRDRTVWTDEDLPRTSTGKVRKGLVRERLVALMREPGAAAPVPSGAPSDVRRLVAEVGRIPPGRLHDSTRLVADLGFGSLDLVEMAAAFEEEFGVSLPEDRLAGAAVGDLERLVRSAFSGAAITAAPRASPGPASEPDLASEPAAAPGPAGRGGLRMPRWARAMPARLFRRLFEEALVRPFVRFFARPEVAGLENLEAAEPPYLFVANHHSYFDTGLFKTLLPLRLRGRIAPGMTTRYHRVFFGERPGGLPRYLKEWLQVRLVELLFGAWPLPETAGFRTSVSYAGELADAGWSLLVFPEGRHVPEGADAPFRKGIGVLARDLRAPVIPAYVEGTARVLPEGRYWPSIGKARLVLGRPLRIDSRADAAETTRLIEAAVRVLRARAEARSPAA